MQHPFDYNNVNDSQKEAIKEVCDILCERGHDKLSDELKIKFSIVERKKYDIGQSKFIKKCRSIGLNPAYQGFIIENNVEYPLFAVSGDVRVLDTLID